MKNRADTINAENAAYDLLLETAPPKIPVDIENLMKKHSNLRVRPYSWYANLSGVPVGEVINQTGSKNGCCYYMADSDAYMILYNDTIKNTGRIRWTLAHEFGHYILGHNKIIKQAFLSKQNLTNQEYAALEKEADIFARNLLMPPNIIAALGIDTISGITSLFDVSATAANNMISYLNMSARTGKFYETDCSLTRHFKNEIEACLYGKKCPVCNYYFAAEHLKYCLICGYESLIKGENEHMIYKGIETDENGRAKLCPVCGNGQPHAGDYCLICGIYLINRCADTVKIHKSVHNFLNVSCGTTLPPNARYCYKCGNESYYYQNGFLKAWNVKDEKTANKLEVIKMQK